MVISFGRIWWPWKRPVFWCVFFMIHGSSGTGHTAAFAASASAASAASAPHTSCPACPASASTFGCASPQLVCIHLWWRMPWVHHNLLNDVVQGPSAQSGTSLPSSLFPPISVVACHLGLLMCSPVKTQTELKILSNRPLLIPRCHVSKIKM